MSKLQCLFGIMFLLSVTFVNAQNSLQVEVTNLRNNTGRVSMNLLDKNEESVKGKTELIIDNRCVITFDSLQVGMYAIQYFHDEDSNKEMETNFIGIPKEGFGFSNDAMGKFGPKDFEEWLVEVKGDTRITVVTTYF